MELFKGEILTSREVFYTKFCKRYRKKQVQERYFPKYGFFSCQFKRKKKKTNTHWWLDFRRSFGSCLVEERRLISRTAAGNRAYFVKISQVSANKEVREVK